MSLLSDTMNRNRIYYFLVAALGVFVIVLALGRDHRGVYSATAAVQPIQETAASRSLTFDEIKLRLCDEEIIVQAVEELRDAGFDKGDELGRLAIAKNIFVQRSDDQDGVSVTYTSSDGDAARMTVDRLCEVYVRRQSEADHLAMSGTLMQQQQAANLALRQAEERRDAAQRNLTEFDDGHDDANHFLQASLTTESDAAETTADATGEKVREQGTKELERQIQILSGQLADQQRIRRQLESRMTAQHPQIVDVDVKIDALREQLKKARLELAQEQELETIAAEIESSKPSVEEIESERAVLLAVLKNAEQQWERCSQQQHDVSERISNSEYTETWSFVSAEVAQYRSAATPLALLVLSGALAMVGGSGMLFAASGMVQTIDTVADVQRVLGIPVVGEVKVAAEPRQQNLQACARFVRFAILFFEITLGVFLLGMLLSAMLVDDFSSQLRTDPLSAMADGLSRLCQLLTG